MDSPLFYILAPFGLAFALFAVYLVVSLLLRDPARPFRMFAAGPIVDTTEQAERLCDDLERLGKAPEPDDERIRILERLLSEGEGERVENLRRRMEGILGYRQKRDGGEGTAN